MLAADGGAVSRDGGRERRGRLTAHPIAPPVTPFPCCPLRPLRPCGFCLLPSTSVEAPPPTRQNSCDAVLARGGTVNEE